MSRRKRRAVLVLTAASAAVAAMLWSVPARWAARREWKKGVAAAAAEDFGGAEAAFKACLASRPADEACSTGQAMASRINRSWTRFQPADAGRRPSAAELAEKYAKTGLEHAERGETAEALAAFRHCLALDFANPACGPGVKLYAALSDGSRAAAPAPGGPVAGLPAPPSEEDKRRAVMHWNEGIKAFQKGDISAARDEWLLCKKFDSDNSDCSTGLARVDSSYGGGQ
ncbi:MAG: hypothetical protein HY928_03575 [Elusimicrobia bacterium]|nr:hypothetical protein [Elusimicrobiota bacterium]